MRFRPLSLTRFVVNSKALEDALETLHTAHASGAEPPRERPAGNGRADTAHSPRYDVQALAGIATRTASRFPLVSFRIYEVTAVPSPRRADGGFSLTRAAGAGVLPGRRPAGSRLGRAEGLRLRVRRGAAPASDPLPSGSRPSTCGRLTLSLSCRVWLAMASALGPRAAAAGRRRAGSLRAAREGWGRREHLDVTAGPPVRTP